ncbi:unnamed protein product [Ixodes persulcatus]
MANAPNLCVGNVESVDYLIAVNSLAKNLVDRNILRTQLWTLHNSNSTIKLVFFLGRPIEPALIEHINEEIRTTDDLVIGNFDGTPENLTLSALMMLQWVVRFCGKAKFVIKVGDSGRVSLKLLRKSLEFFKELSTDFDMFGNYVSLDGEPCLESQREMSIGTCPGRGYLSGCAYMVVDRMVGPLLKAARGRDTVPPEDVFVTGVLARDAGARRADVAHFDGCYLTFPKRPTVWQQGLLPWLRDRFRNRYRLLLRKLNRK